jgi:hypothetical protein
LGATVTRGVAVRPRAPLPSAWLESLDSTRPVANLQLALRREPGNPHDALAIRVQRSDGTLLGYIPRSRNEVLARLMDAGKLIVARLETKEWQGWWLRLEIKVVLREV